MSEQVGDDQSPTGVNLTSHRDSIIIISGNPRPLSGMTCLKRSAKMNRLEIHTHFNKFTGRDYFVLAIDGVPMGDILHQIDPLGSYENDGVVPTLLDWLDDPKEREVVWSRITPEEKKTTLAPILMCSEDIDLLCTVVVAEAYCQGDFVYWKRIGVDVGSETNPEMIGKEVSWFDGLSYEFDIENYRDIVDKFKNALNMAEQVGPSKNDSRLGDSLARFFRRGFSAICRLFRLFHHSG